MIDGTIRIGDHLVSPAGTAYTVTSHAYWPGVTWTFLVSRRGHYRREIRSVLQRDWSRDA